jgi:hypothetical protein
MFRTSARSANAAISRPKSGRHCCLPAVYAVSGHRGSVAQPAEFLTFLWWKSGSEIRRPRPEISLPIERSAIFPSSCALRCIFKRILVVGNGNIDVGKKTPTRKGGQRIVEDLTVRDGSPKLRIDDPNPRQKEPVKVCGAMSQQYGDGSRGNESAPQKFVHLVGCRDPKARPEPWIRPNASSAKR